jgi:hypothetical protein
MPSASSLTPLSAKKKEKSSEALIKAAEQVVELQLRVSELVPE